MTNFVNGRKKKVCVIVEKKFIRKFIKGRLITVIDKVLVINEN